MDNQSTDGSLALREKYPRVTLVELDRNQGYAGPTTRRPGTPPGRPSFNNDTKMDLAVSPPWPPTPTAGLSPTFSPSHENLRRRLRDQSRDGCDPSFPINSGSFYADGAAYVIRRALFERLGDSTILFHLLRGVRPHLAGAGGGATSNWPEAVVCHFMGGLSPVFTLRPIPPTTSGGGSERNNFEASSKIIPGPSSASSCLPT